MLSYMFTNYYTYKELAKQLLTVLLFIIIRFRQEITQEVRLC